MLDCDVKIGDYVETLDAHKEEINGIVTAIHEHTFIVDGGRGDFRVIPKRFFINGFPKTEKKQDVDYFVPYKRVAFR